MSDPTALGAHLRRMHHYSEAMDLGLMLSYLTVADSPSDSVELARAAERLGFAVVWTAESYGGDAVTYASWIAAHTSAIDVGTAVMQIPGRSPAMTAMTATTLDLLSGGRFRLGVGVSGPQVSEGWHGVRFAKPVARTREYLTVVRAAIARETVVHPGAHYQLPLPEGPGKALKLNLKPLRTTIPTYLASVGPRSLELCGELADGWLAVFFDTELGARQLGHIRTGRERGGRTMADFDVAIAAGLVVGDDLERCADELRPAAALYIGGMGSREENYYNRMARDMGFVDAAEQIQDLFLGGRQRDAAAAVPTEFITRTALVGSVDQIAARLKVLAAAGVTTCSVTPHGRTLDQRIDSLAALAEAATRANS